MRTRAFRRHQAQAKMWRRLKEDRNQHYNVLTCACYRPGKAMARFKEQPKACSCPGCANRRQYDGPTFQERKADEARAAPYPDGNRSDVDQATQ